MLGVLAMTSNDAAVHRQTALGGGAIGSPPAVHFTDLVVRFRGGSDRQAHRRVRDSSKIADAGRRRPASADFKDIDSASCKARHSSPSSS